MEYRFRRRNLQVWYAEGVGGDFPTAPTYALKIITADFDLRQSTRLDELTFAQNLEPAEIRQREFELVYVFVPVVETQARAPMVEGFFTYKFSAEATVYGFAWVQTGVVNPPTDPLFIVVKYSAPVTVRAGDSHGIAHTVRYGPALVLPA